VDRIAIGGGFFPVANCHPSISGQIGIIFHNCAGTSAKRHFGSAFLSNSLLELSGVLGLPAPDVFDVRAGRSWN
jgi:hypothetical protein